MEPPNVRVSRSIAFSIILMSILFRNAALARDSGFGLGIILGEPIGLSGKLWVGERKAFDIAAAWPSNKDDGVDYHVHADYLIHSFRYQFVLYYGFGVRAKLEEDEVVGMRFPLGMTYIVKTAFDVFLEIAPLLDLSPSTDFHLDAAIGFRYFLW